MKKFLFLIANLGIGLILQAQVSKTVYLASAGILYDSLTKTEDITNLKIIGNINAFDFKTMMYQMPKLEVIDLSEATIVATITNPGQPPSASDANMIPATAFFYYSDPATMTDWSKTSLTSIILPQNLKSIGSGAFIGCSGLKTIIIPSSVTSIQSSAFEKCSGLTSIYAYADTPVYLGKTSGVFSGVDTAICTLYVPSGSKAEYDTASQWKAFKHIVEDSGLVTIGTSQIYIQTFQLCQGKSVTVGTHTYTSNGIYTDQFITKTGCDSIVHTLIFVNPIYNITQTKSICQGENINVGTHSYTQSGTFIDNLKTKLGCDSIVHTQVIVNPTYNITQTKTICQGESISVGSHSYTQSGKFTDNLKTKLGCDSIVQTHITVTALPTISLGSDTVHVILGTTITLDAEIGFSYKWSTKDTSQTITVVKPGEYSVTVSNSCGTATDSMFLNTTMTYISSVNDDNITMFPNPTSSYFSTKNEGSAILELYTLNAVLVLKEKIEGDEKIAVNKLAKGSYIVKIITKNNVVTKTLIVE